MPVWHAQTEAARESGELVVLGVVQEQHPDRARLFAQWHQIDWPILWDPFNTLGDAVVPVYRLIDEHGVLRDGRPRSEAIDPFLAANFEAPRGPASPPPSDEADRRTLVALDDLAPDDPARRALEITSALLFERRPPTDAELTLLASRADASAADLFRLGVARRMRHDSPARTSRDFAAALEVWSAALELDPSQYIWRRRIQQFGPRLDKPYPFYDWIDEARAAVEARGEVPFPLPVALTGSERASRGDFEAAAAAATEPDPEGRVPRDLDGLFTVDSAVAFDTDPARNVARLHLWISPTEGSGGHWNNESGPARVWLDASSLPDGWALEDTLLELPGPATATSEEVRAIDLELRAPEGFSGEATLSGYLLTDACRDDGVCFHLRRNLTVSIRR